MISFLLLVLLLAVPQNDKLEKSVLENSAKLTDSFSNIKVTGRVYDLRIKASGDRREVEHEAEYYRLGDKHKYVKNEIGGSPHQIFVATKSLSFGAQKGESGEMEVLAISHDTNGYKLGIGHIGFSSAIMRASHCVDNVPFPKLYATDIKKLGPVWAEVTHGNKAAVELKVKTKPFEAAGKKYFDDIRYVFSKDLGEILECGYSRIEVESGMLVAKQSREISYKESEDGVPYASSVLDLFVDDKGELISKFRFDLDSIEFGTTEEIEFTLEGCGLGGMFSGKSNRRVWLMFAAAAVGIASLILIRSRSKSR